MYFVFLPLLSIIFCIVSVSTIEFIPQYAISTTVNNFLTYENSNHRLTIQYPADWDKDEGIPILDEILGGGNIVSFTPSTNMDVTFRVFVYKPNDISSFPYSNTTLDELVAREIVELRNSPSDFRIISSEPTTLANNPAYEIVYYYAGGRESVTMEIWTLKNDKAYKIQYTAVDVAKFEDFKRHILTATSQFSHYLPTAQKMIDTFNIDTAGGVGTASTTVPPAVTKDSSEPSSLPEQRLNETQQQQPPAESSGDYYGLILFLMIIAVAAAIITKIRGRGRRGKFRERRGFPDYVKEEVLRKQNHRCAHCNRILNVVDWDHKDGNRSNNKESNCQALCPNCHAVKTRRGK